MERKSAFLPGEVSRTQQNKAVFIGLCCGWSKICREKSAEAIVPDGS